MAPILTDEDVVRRIAAECAFVDERGGADELAADGDHDGATTWRRITAAVAELANNTPPGPLH